MIQVTRNEAENLFNCTPVLSSFVKQTAQKLCVTIHFTNDQACCVCYNLKDQKKQYYVNASAK